ncbi:9908_t:CDS:2, partial [Funneliformis geosporum]
MKFVDEILLTVKAGDGGSVNGQKQLKTGKNATDIYIKVPLGTIIKLANSFSPLANSQELVLGEILFPQQKLLIAKGGKGGWGNAAFASSVNRSPHYAQKGIPGQKLPLKLELKILAEVGLLGLPNAGKSTLINALTNAQVRTASFPFTTLHPQLGVLTYKDRKITIADLPGIIEGAAQGKGLGLKFLRHIMRCALIIYLLDASQDNPPQELAILEKELHASGIAESATAKSVPKHFLISALQKTNLDLLVKEIYLVLQEKSQPISSPTPVHKIYDFTNLSQKYPQPEKLVQELKKANLSEYLQQKK